ncbi:hypothetical protein Taro_055149, partial [Colocasia esculenta]|nr:hypothetical protein [Colocasia esculenta]
LHKFAIVVSTHPLVAKWCRHTSAEASTPDLFGHVAAWGSREFVLDRVPTHSKGTIGLMGLYIFPNIGPPTRRQIQKTLAKGFGGKKIYISCSRLSRCCGDPSPSLKKHEGVKESSEEGVGALLKGADPAEASN